jgi:hypothetical protein
MPWHRPRAACAHVRELPARRAREDHRRRSADARTTPRPGPRAAGHRRRTTPTLRAPGSAARGRGSAVELLLQRGGGGELRGAAGGDLDRLTGRGIASLASSALAHAELAEARFDRHPTNACSHAQGRYPDTSRGARVDQRRGTAAGFAVTDVPPECRDIVDVVLAPFKATAARLASLGPDGLTSSPLRG